MNRLLNTVLLLFVFLCSLVCASQPSESTVKELRKSTVKVRSGTKSSTGFIWKNPRWIVTTLHTIENTNDIQITFDGDVGNAKVIKVLKKYDLALLELEKEPNFPVLNVSASTPSLNSTLYVLGYNGEGNFGNVIDRTLRLGYNASGKLEGLLPKQVRKDLSNCKSPDPVIEILYFEGSLLPGFSGSPIVDNSGSLVGIADGGLENGAQSISWGISASQLEKLASSFDPVEKSACGSLASSVKFSSEDIQDEKRLEYVNYEGYQFVKVKTRTIAEMQSTIDDPIGLQQLISAFSLSNNVDYLSFKYDIYLDASSGATLCLPEGLTLHEEDGVLYAAYPDSSMAYVAWPHRVSGSRNDAMRFQEASEQFDTFLITDNIPLVYQPDVSYSYLMPQFYENGFAVNRKAFRGYAVDYYGNYIPQTYFYQTHIGFGDTYLGMAVKHFESTQEVLNLLQNCVFSGQCLGNSSYADCDLICENYNQFAKLALGVHMGGFSNVSYEN